MQLKLFKGWLLGLIAISLGCQQGSEPGKCQLAQKASFISLCQLNEDKTACQTNTQDLSSTLCLYDPPLAAQKGSCTEPDTSMHKKFCEDYYKEDATCRAYIYTGGSGENAFKELCGLSRDKSACIPAPPNFGACSEGADGSCGALTTKLIYGNNVTARYCISTPAKPASPANCTLDLDKNKKACLALTTKDACLAAKIAQQSVCQWQL